jgi:Mycothiol maleylpyruvate isomerase N-terminal domain
MKACVECGFDWDRVDPGAIIESLATAGPRYTDALAPFGDEQVHSRPTASTWSALEYTAHTRETLAFYDERVRRVITEHRPRLEAFGFADAAERDAYNAEVVVFTLEGLSAAADRFAGRLRDLPDDAWERFGIGSDGGTRTVLLLARRGAHEVEHHLMDVRRVYDATR